MGEDRRNALTPGTELEGYRIDSILGAGGFGITYRATEILLNRPVAIKEFLPAGMAIREADGLGIVPIGATEAADFNWGLDRFRQEAQTLVAFRHPNIVGVHRYFETNGSGYLVMEFVEGRTLAQLLNPDKVLSEDEIHEIIGPLLDGLQAVHDKGFLHRDIKPANIFIREDGTPVLIDFGAARLALGQQSLSLTAVISAGYAPYEQYDSAGDQGPWTDIYALGGVLYRCVTGVRPPDAPSRVSAVFAGREDPMASAAKAATQQYPSALLALVDNLLALREGDRPQTVVALRSMLGESASTPAVAPVAVPVEKAGNLEDAKLRDEPGNDSEKGASTLLVGSVGDDLKQAEGIADDPAPKAAQPPEPPEKPARHQPDRDAFQSRVKSPAEGFSRAKWVRAIGTFVVVVAVGYGIWAFTLSGEHDCAARISTISNAVDGRSYKDARRMVDAAYAANCGSPTLDALDGRILAASGGAKDRSEDIYRRLVRRNIGQGEGGLCRHYVDNALRAISKRNNKDIQQALKDAEAAQCSRKVLDRLQQVARNTR